MSNPIQLNPPEIDRAEHDAYIAKLLRSRHKAAALPWLARSKRSNRRVLAGCPGAKSSIALVHELYAAGAVTVTAVEIKTKPTGSQWTEKLVVGLPNDAKLRKALLAWCRRHRKEIGYSPVKDTGETHLYILLD